jgi:hypothetical protein
MRPNMPASSAPQARRKSADIRPRKPVARSRVTNGSDVLPGIDGRGVIARRYRDIASAIVADQGGADRLAEARLQLIRRFAAAAVLAEQMEAALANGTPINISEHALLTSSMVRVGLRIGINRRAREIVPSLQHYLETQGDGGEADAEDEPVQ